MSKRVCIITGASRGIGLATALRFARAGHDIVAAARGAAGLQELANRVLATGVGCEALPVDIAAPAAASEILDVAVKRFGRVDVLVNNAGVAPLHKLDEFEPGDFDAAIATNCGAVYHLSRAAWPILRQQGGGVIVNISSVASVDPFPGFSIYGACKAWVNLFTKALAAEGKPLGIRVYAVAPGAVETSMLRSAFPDFPTEHTLAPDDIAAAVEAVCDDRLAHSSGQTIFVRR